MPRPQFSIRTLLWLTLIAAVLLGTLTGVYRYRSRASSAISDPPVQRG